MEFRRKENRCGHCNKLLGFGTVRNFEIKCTRCGTLNHLRDTSPSSEPCKGRLEQERVRT